MILRGHKISLANTLNKLATALGFDAGWATPSAYCQARDKLEPELFLHLNRITTSTFYEREGARDLLRRWKGYRVLATDGTYLQLPDLPETRERFTVQTNQIPGFACVQALASVLYDVLDDVGLNIALAPSSSEARFLFDEHAEFYGEGDLMVLDRLYADYWVFAYFAQHQRHLVVRCATRGLAAIQAFWASEATDALVTLVAPKALRPKMHELGLALEVAVRLVKVPLEDGQIEVLATTLVDQAQATREELKELYGLRWGVETYFGRIKGIFEVERLAGKNLKAIEQEIYGVLFLATLESVLSRPADEEMADESRRRGHKYEKRVNRATSYVALVDHAVQLLSDPKADTEEILERLQELFKTGASSRRPGRRTPRNVLRPSRRLRHHRYRKRLVL